MRESATKEVRQKDPSVCIGYLATGLKVRDTNSWPYFLLVNKTKSDRIVPFTMKTKTNGLTPDIVKRIASLAMISLTNEEIRKFQHQLSDILRFVTHLNQISTHTVTPTSQVTGLENIFREDIVKPSLSQEDALSNAPKSHNGYFQVKPVQDN